MLGGEDGMAHSLQTQIQVAIGEHIDFGVRCGDGVNVVGRQHRRLVLVFEGECHLGAAAAQIQRGNGVWSIQAACKWKQ